MCDSLLIVIPLWHYLWFWAYQYMMKIIVWYLCLYYNESFYKRTVIHINIVRYQRYFCLFLVFGVSIVEPTFSLSLSFVSSSSYYLLLIHRSLLYTRQNLNKLLHSSSYFSQVHFLIYIYLRFNIPIWILMLWVWIPLMVRCTRYNIMW
jgi:subtilase family serine protease